MATTHSVYLVPGFFGFANLGEFYYFNHLYDELSLLLEARGLKAEVFRVPTHPTASTRRRALRLFEAIERTAGGDGPIHLICHSSGGLDARLLVSPGAELDHQVDTEPIAKRVRTVVTLACPHRGTPLASFFAGAFGIELLRLLSLATVYVLRYGHLPLSFFFKLSSLVTKLDNSVGWKDTLIDQLFLQLLSDFSPERRDVVRRFFEEVGAEQALILQLTPESMDVFNASCRDRKEVAYGSVVTRAHPPTPRLFLSTWNPYLLATRAIYGVLHYQASRQPGASVERPSHEHAAALRRAFGRMPRKGANDGVVPTLSQPWGEVLAAVEADHLDVIGHFDDRHTNPPHIDWLSTGTGFTREAFEDTCRKIVAFMAAHS